MMTSRKQQREIELATKKVQDGVTEFSALWQKVEDAEDAKERDKWMADMKRELKRLQRLRDQFRTWAEDPTIRDHTPLLEMRRAVEVQMERFKDLEKEAKIKPFAKAGLSQKEKMDPAVVAKLECEAWLQSAINRLAEQMEQFEADSEALSSSLEDSKRPPEKVAELQGFIKRHEAQTAKLEQVLRLVENEQVSPEEVNETLKESMEHYLACSTEPDFVEDELMYDSLPLGEGLENVGRIQAHDSRALPAVSTAGDTSEHSAEGTPKEGSSRAGKAKQGAGKSTLGGKRVQNKDGQRGGEKRGRNRSATSPSAASLLPTPFKEAAAKAIVAAPSAVSATSASPVQPPGFPAIRAGSHFSPQSSAVDQSSAKGPKEEVTAVSVSTGPASPLASAATFTAAVDNPSYEEAWPKPVATVASTEAPGSIHAPLEEEREQERQGQQKQQPALQSSPQPLPPTPPQGTPPRSDPYTGTPTGSQDVMGSPVWHSRNPELSATLKGMRSCSTAQLLHGLSMPPTSPLLRAEQAADAYLHTLSPNRYALSQVQGLEYGVEEVARQMHGFNAPPLPSSSFSPRAHQAAHYSLPSLPHSTHMAPLHQPVHSPHALLSPRVARQEAMGSRFSMQHSSEATGHASLPSPPGLSEASFHHLQPMHVNTGGGLGASSEQIGSPFSQFSNQQSSTFGEMQQPSPLTRLRRALDLELQARKQGARGATTGHLWVGDLARASADSLARALDALDRQFQIQWSYQTSPGDWAKVDQILTLLKEAEVECSTAQIQAVYPQRQKPEQLHRDKSLEPESQYVTQQEHPHDSVKTKLKELKEQLDVGPLVSKRSLQPGSLPASPSKSSQGGQSTGMPLQPTSSDPALLRRRSLDLDGTECKREGLERSDVQVRLTSSLDPEDTAHEVGVRRAVTPDPDPETRRTGPHARAVRYPGRADGRRQGRYAPGFPPPQIIQRGRGMHRVMSARAANEFRSPSPVTYRSASPRSSLPARYSPTQVGQPGGQSGGPFVSWRSPGVPRADATSVTTPPPPPPPPRLPSQLLPVNLLTPKARRQTPRDTPQAPKADPVAYSLLDVEHQKPYWASSIRKYHEANLLASGKDFMPQEADRAYFPPREPVSVFEQPQQNPVGKRNDTWPLREMWMQDVIPILDQPDFFQRTAKGACPEAALFAVFFQQGSHQEKHAAELLRSQGWRFHGDLQRWFYRTTPDATQQEKGTEGNEWVYWDPFLGPDKDGWCARQAAPGSASNQQTAPSMCAV